MSRVAIAVFALAVAGAGCTRVCKPGTMLVQLGFDATAASADHLLVELTSGGKTLKATTTHAVGNTSGSLEIDFANGYVAGSKVDVAVFAERGNVIVADAHAAGVSLASGCSNLALALGAADMTPPALRPPDLAGFGPTVKVAENATNKMDILFMVDNSPSMDAMQTQLKTQFGKVLQPFIDLAATGYYADLHIGVVTSDYGAGDVTNVSDGCSASPGGQKGLLQTTAAANTPQAGCAGPLGTPFIQYAFNGGGNTSNLPSGAALADTFTCMASVGSRGCGFEHQLESVYAALHNQFENAGFLRDDAVLAVVFFTNEDDGSAPPTSDFYNVDPAKLTMYGAADTYRQTRFGVGCGMPFMMAPYASSMGALMGCIGAPNPMTSPTLEYDVQRYIDYFTLPASMGGVKADPSNVVLVAFDGPETPFATRVVQIGTGNGIGTYPVPAAYEDCQTDMGLDGKNCFVRVDHSCQNTVQPAFFADPSVRLNSVVRAAQFNQIASICGEDSAVAPDYSNALSATGNLLRSRMLGNCLPNQIANPQDPQCEVLQTVAGDGGGTTTALPRCDEGSPPCWKIVQQSSCAAVAPGAVAITITRAQPAPPGTTVTASCRTP